MNLVEKLVAEKIAQNPFHASNMLNVLDCGSLDTDEERLARCRLYKAWKATGENKAESRKKAIEGVEPPPQMFEVLPDGL